MPPPGTAAGITNTACASERASEIAPTRDGDGTSPKMWIVKMLTATAVARMCGATTFTSVELTGPVEANNSSSATTIAAQYTGGAGAARATRVRGAAPSVAIPDTHRYACFE